MTRLLHLAPATLLLMACSVEYTVPLDTDGPTSSDSGDNDGSENGDDDTCDEALLSCGGDCVDPQEDPAHCGGCDQPCDENASCEGGECLDSCGGACDPTTEVCIEDACVCRSGFDRCGDMCVDPDSNVANCGECGEDCVEVEDEGVEVGICEDRDCRDHDAACSDGLTQCGQSCVDLASHPLHCDACNRACDGDQECIDGQCEDG